MTKQLHDDLVWAIKQPRHTYPLWVLHNEIQLYLHFYDPFDESDSAGAQQQQQQDLEAPELPASRKELLTQQSRDAAESHRDDALYQVMDATVEHVHSRLAKTLPQLAADERKGFVRSARESADTLLRAKRREWDAFDTLDSGWARYPRRSWYLDSESEVNA